MELNDKDQAKAGTPMDGEANSTANDVIASVERVNGTQDSTIQAVDVRIDQSVITEDNVKHTDNDSNLLFRNGKADRNTAGKRRQKPASFPGLYNLVKEEPMHERLNRKRAILRFMLKKEERQLQRISKRARVALLSVRPPPKPRNLAQTPLDLSRTPKAGVINSILSSFEAKKGVFTSKPVNLRRKHASLSLEELERSMRAGADVQLPTSDAKISVHSFSIQYNEVSIAAIANWGIPSGKSGENTNEQANYFAVDSKFRKCGICFRWGHYEIECPRQSEDHAVQLGGNICKTVEVEAEDESVGYHAVYEECSGFSIEQRAEHVSEHKNSSSPLKSKAPIQVKSTKQQTMLDGLVIKATGGRGGAEPMLKKGDFVVWFIENRVGVQRNHKEDVGAGIIVRSSESKAASLVKTIEIIPSTRCDREKVARKHGKFQWIGTDNLTLVKPKAFVDKYCRRRLASNTDGTIDPRSSPRVREDGTYVQPKGRKPKGFEWNIERGKWVRLPPVCK